MADNAIPTQTSASPRRGNRRHGPPSAESHFSREHNNQGSPARGGRGNRGYRGGRGRGRSQPNENSLDATAQNPQQNPGEPRGTGDKGSFGGRMTKPDPQTQTDPNPPDGEQEANAAAPEEAEGEVCFICASTIEHTSIGPCNHQTCHICALRLRALYKTKACAHCRTEAEFVLFTDDPTKRYEDFEEKDFVKVDDNLGVKFETDVILEDTILLLRYNCPDKECDVQCLSWPDLHRHVKSKHGKVMCDLCTRNKKVFTHEHELFSYGELRRHERFGDDNPGAVDQSGFKGHPECGFCRQRFYGDDELYNHCREKHERCHICDRRNPGRQPQYYLNYQELEKHFAETHFVCLDPECQANKTNVFESEMDLKAHQLSEHPGGSKDVRRDARIVNLSGFDLRAPYQPERRGNRDHRGGGRGRDPNADPLPISSAQPIGRAELAFQRQMAVQSSQTISNRNFGGQLTQSAPSPRPQPQPQPQQQQPRPTPPTTTLDTLSLNDASTLTPTAPNSAFQPPNPALAARHAAVTARATTLSHNSAPSLSQFRTLVSSYRTSTITAPALVDRLATDVFPNAPGAELGKLVRELADLYDNEAKRQGLLEAWNGFRSASAADAGAEDYPMLPVPTGGSASSSSSLLGGRRVLRLKSSTGPSSRSAVSRQGSWGNNALAAPGSGTGAGLHNPFPPLSSSSSSKSKSNNTASAWGTSTSTSDTNIKLNTQPQPRTQTLASRTTTSTASRPPPHSNEEMFPSLPPTQKPSVLMAGLTRGTVRWTGPGSGSNTPSTSAWSPAPTPAQAAAIMHTGGDSADFADADVDTSEGGGGVKKKGKKGKGQVLYHFG